MTSSSPNQASEDATRPDTAIDFLYLSEPDMIRAGVTDMPRCVETMEEVLALLHTGDYRMAGDNNDSHGALVLFPAESEFPDMPLATPDRRFMAMPAYLGGSFGQAGVKWYGSNIANRDRGLPRSIHTFTLNDADTGAPLAIMSANLLSAYRTGAIPGVGAKYFAPEDAKVVGIQGPGTMAKTSLAAFMAVRPGIETVKVLGRGRASLDAFTAWVARHFPQLLVEEVDSLEAVVRDSDIVTFCASGVPNDPAQYPTVERAWVKPGAFLSMPAAVNIDAGMEAPEVRKVVDNYGLYEAWADENPAPTHRYIPILGCRFTDLVAEGKLARTDIEDMGAVVTGQAPGRKSAEEIVLYSVGGMPVEDVAWASVVYRNAIEQGIGVQLNLWDTPELA
jgi:ornithine cyclodeaminase/alanine dehydrogenase-like protein (mu-crystallin family)